jgi:hypothetical protein
MTRKLFRSFERFGVEYLLISGQASVLYGAALFSEDIDLWIRPAARNVRRLLQALAACRARVYKLTPPLTLRHLLRGHGFHFLIPERPDPIYVDVLGRPPRVGSFASALRACELVPTPWGVLPVVSIPDLVALKKTRRLQDYEIISDLVRIHLERIGTPSRKLLRWAYRETFRAEDRREFASRLGIRTTLARCRREVAHKMQRLQAADTSYWRRIVHELRDLRDRGALLPEGTSVSALLGKAQRP